jgi:hypothetical protein
MADVNVPASGGTVSAEQATTEPTFKELPAFEEALNAQVSNVLKNGGQAPTAEREQRPLTPQEKEILKEIEKLSQDFILEAFQKNMQMQHTISPKL